MTTFSLTPKIIYQDQSFLVIDKPSGLIVNRAQTVKGKTLQDWLEENFADHKLPRAGIVHRLDKETSGLLLVAKTFKSLAHLQAQFRLRKVTKKYLSLVHGRVDFREGVISLPMARNPLNRKKFRVFLGGREAKTKYRVKAYYSQANENEKIFTFLELFPETGRTHQLRVHLKHLHYPIVSDSIYGGRKTSQADKIWCPRLFLHASFIAFIHPQKGQKTSFSSPLPEFLKKALEKLTPSPKEE